MFDLVIAAGRDACCRCGEKIESIDDLSIEHLEPWENREVSLYWDLNNIGFSHLNCNRPHVVRRDKKFLVPEGLWRCNVCKENKPSGAFAPAQIADNRDMRICKICKRVENAARERRKSPVVPIVS